MTNSLIRVHVSHCWQDQTASIEGKSWRQAAVYLCRKIQHSKSQGCKDCRGKMQKALPRSIGCQFSRDRNWAKNPLLTLPDQYCRYHKLLLLARAIVWTLYF